MFVAALCHVFVGFLKGKYLSIQEFSLGIG